MELRGLIAEQEGRVLASVEEVNDARAGMRVPQEQLHTSSQYHSMTTEVEWRDHLSMLKGEIDAARGEVEPQGGKAAVRDPQVRHS